MAYDDSYCLKNPTSAYCMAKVENSSRFNTSNIPTIMNPDGIMMDLGWDLYKYGTEAPFFAPGTIPAQIIGGGILDNQIEGIKKSFKTLSEATPDQITISDEYGNVRTEDKKEVPSTTDDAYFSEGNKVGGNMKGLKKITQKDRYGNMLSLEFEVPPMEEIPHPGGPKGTDTVPAWLTPGERVMNAEAERMYGPVLKQMNDEGRALQRAQGGTIPDYAAMGCKVKYKAQGGPVYANEGTWVTDAFLDSLKQKESGGDPYAINLDTEAAGAYQWMPDNYMSGDIGFGVEKGSFNPYDEEVARERTRQYLEGIQAQNPDWTPQEVAQAYNWGPGNMAKYKAGEITELPEETRKYVEGLAFAAPEQQLSESEQETGRMIPTGYLNADIFDEGGAFPPPQNNTPPAPKEDDGNWYDGIVNWINTPSAYGQSMVGASEDFAQSQKVRQGTSLDSVKGGRGTVVEKAGERAKAAQVEAMNKPVDMSNITASDSAAYNAYLSSFPPTMTDNAVSFEQWVQLGKPAPATVPNTELQAIPGQGQTLKEDEKPKGPSQLAVETEVPRIEAPKVVEGKETTPESPVMEKEADNQERVKAMSDIVNQNLDEGDEPLELDDVSKEEEGFFSGITNWLSKQTDGFDLSGTLSTVGESLKDFIGDSGLLDSQELKRAALLYLGSRAMGYDHTSSGQFATKNYLNRLQTKSKASMNAAAKRKEQAFNLVKDGKATPKSAEMYARTGNLAYIEADMMGGQPQGEYQSFFKGGKQFKAQKVKLPNGSIVYKTDDGKVIDGSYTQDAAFHKGTPEYKERRDRSHNLHSKIFEESFELAGGKDSDTNDWTSNLKVGPKKAADEYWAWAESTGRDADSTESRTIMGRAYQEALKDAKEGKTSVPSLVPYLKTQHFRETTGTNELWNLNADDPKATPKYVRQDKMNELFDSADALARMRMPKKSAENQTVARKQVFDVILDAWGKLPDAERKSYQDSTEKEAGITGFYMFAQDQLQKGFLEQQAK